MKKFFDTYLNVKKIMEEKKKYRQQAARIAALPEEYRYVYEKIQKYLWSFAAGDGMDLVKIQEDLLELFEECAADGKKVLEVTGQDVAGFADELMKQANTYPAHMREKLNRDVARKAAKTTGTETRET